MKSKLLKAADVSGFTFLMPVIRFAYGDERQKQIGEMGRMILVPLLAIGLFLAAWAVISPLVKTKSGELPGPAMTEQAAEDIWSLHRQENAKEASYYSDPADAEAKLKQTQARLAELKTAQAKVDALVASESAKSDAILAERLDPFKAKVAAFRTGTKADAKQREAKLAAYGRSLAADDRAGRQKLLAMTRAHLAKVDLDRETLRDLDAKVAETSRFQTDALKDALALQTEIAEEKQFLEAVEGLLVRNRQAQIDASVARLNERKVAYLAATGDDVAAQAVKVVKAQDRVVTMQDASFPKTFTLPMQVLRSILCVFVGFLLGVAVAIPIGVLCGLSPTFMSAMTPFIALFKPVSPIVWILIALIVVGGVLPDPDKNPVILALAELPLIGWMKINPAFIASAITVALCSLWPTMTNTALGVASISDDHMNVARVLKLGFGERLLKIVIPSALPLIFAGMRISLGVGWMVLIAAELLSTSEGIGKFVADQWQNGASDSFAKMIVVVFVVGAIGLLLDRIMVVFQRAVSFDGAPAAV